MSPYCAACKQVEDELRGLVDASGHWVPDTGNLHLRSYVDTGPLIERVYAKYAGIGWIAKNTCIINQQLGSWLFLGVILTSLELTADLPAPDRCGTCTRCITACPTQAIVAPGELDARLCISYLTIEKRGEIPDELRPGMGRHVFGCDICQDVCPWNRKAPATSAPEFEPREGLVNPALDWLAGMQTEEFRATFRGSPVRRAKLSGLRRNAVIAMGNSGDKKFLPTLKQLREDPDPVVAEHASWAAARLEFPVETRLASSPSTPRPTCPFTIVVPSVEAPMFQKDLLQGKRILITGGGTGLGKAAAQRFLELGAEVYICGRRAGSSGRDRARVARAHRRQDPLPTLRCARRRHGRRNDWRHLGRGPLDVLINNAAGNFLARTEELSLGAFQSVIGIVLMGTLHTTLACGRRWLAAGRGGMVLNITTTYTTTGSAYVVPSAVAKAGVQALIRSLAVEWGNRGIRMNAIAPGPIPTEGAFSRLLPRPELEQAAKKRNPLGRFGTTEEFANLAAFLISDGAGVYQWRSGHHGWRRVAARSRRIHSAGTGADRKRMGDDEAKTKEDERLTSFP